jgi:amidase
MLWERDKELRSTSPGEVEAAAAALGIEFRSEELPAVVDQLSGIIAGLNGFIEEQGLGGGRGLPRAAGRTMSEPDEEADDYRAFITRCRITATGEGVLSGYRVSVKDHVSVAGLPQSLGSSFMAGYAPDQDATIVTRLLEAGAELVGTNNMDEFSMSENGFAGQPINPRDPDRYAGGSSSGSAVAVAAGYVDAAIGGDQGGSIRLPAAFCRVVGLKPTYGLVPHTGVMSGFEPTSDYAGPIAATVDKVAAVLTAIAGDDGHDPRQRNLPARQDYTDLAAEPASGMRVGVLREGLIFAEEDVAACFEDALAALRALGVETIDLSIPDHLTARGAWTLTALEGAYYMWATSFGGAFARGWYPEGFVSTMGSRLGASTELMPLTLRSFVTAGQVLHRRYGGRLYALGQNLRPRYVEAYDRALRNLDAIVMPTVPFAAPATYDADPLDRFRPYAERAELIANTVPFNYTGHPALTVPIGSNELIGAQLVGAWFDEKRLLRLGRAVESLGRS